MDRLINQCIDLWIDGSMDQLIGGPVEGRESVCMRSRVRTASLLVIGQHLSRYLAVPLEINADKEDFASCLACPFLAPFSSVFHTSELGRRLKSNNLGNGQYFFPRGFFTPSTSSI